MNNATRLQYLEAMGIDVRFTVHQAQTGVVAAVDVDEVSSIKQTVALVEASAKVWDVLEKQVSGCKNCELCHSRTQTVFGAGNNNADWMFVGEVPGQSEDLAGQPFVGQAGKLLTEMIQAIGLTRESVYIANILKCRPPNDRAPKVEEIHACSHYLQQQIALVKPKVILAVGRVAAQTLLKTNEPLSKLRGVSHQLTDIPLVVIYHPAYLLRFLPEKRQAWQDLQLANTIYQKIKTL